jgi:uncharacterized membrane protein YcaP (DUF421 family)
VALMDLVIRAVVLYAFIVIIMRVMGRRELTTLSPIDLVLLIVLGDAVQQGLTQDDYSVTGTIIVIGTIATLQLLTSYLGFRSRIARRVLEGDPLVLIEDGKLIERNMRRERLTPADVAEEMRVQQIGSFDKVKWAILERSGEMTFIKKDDA